MQRKCTHFLDFLCVKSPFKCSDWEVVDFTILDRKLMDEVHLYYDVPQNGCGSDPKCMKPHNTCRKECM